VVDTLVAYLDGAKYAHEVPKKLSTNAQRMKLTNIKLRWWCKLNSQMLLYVETLCFVVNFHH
jgi:hypothetical protein